MSFPSTERLEASVVFNTDVSTKQGQALTFLFMMTEEDRMHIRNHDDGENGDATGWSAFIAGALIGAGVALLFAPQAGTETRGALRNYANRAKDELMEKGEEAWDAAIERGKEYYDKGEEVVRNAGRSTREVIQRGEEAVKDAGRSTKEFANQAQAAVREAGR